MFTRPGAPSSSELLSLLQEQSNKQASSTSNASATPSSSLDTSILALLLRSQPRLAETQSQPQLPSLLPSVRNNPQQNTLPGLLTLAVGYHQQQQLDLFREAQHARFASNPLSQHSQQMLQSDLYYRLLAQDVSNGLARQQQLQLNDTQCQLPSKTTDSLPAMMVVEQPRQRDDNLLHKLGTTLPRRSDPFTDVSKIQGPPPTDETFRRNKGGVNETFPEKLHRVLTELDGKHAHIVSFLGHGRAFVIHDTARFATELMPQYFCGQGKWSSFARQLRLYGFLRIHAGPDTGAYYHALFLRGRPELCSCMRRVGAPQGHEQSRKTAISKNSNACHASKTSDSASLESATHVRLSRSNRALAVREGAAPNFYAMDPLP
ncbi:hypothetical protein MPSEU_001001400 [Mayamaea pseudoterrestris]|nr:hypothetical protein MPSEU_001001400 [Mayamaea pseudoterrestris]